MTYTFIHIVSRSCDFAEEAGNHYLGYFALHGAICNVSYMCIHLCFYIIVSTTETTSSSTSNKHSKLSFEENFNKNAILNAYKGSVQINPVLSICDSLLLIDHITTISTVEMNERSVYSIIQEYRDTQEQSRDEFDKRIISKK